MTMLLPLRPLPHTPTPPRTRPGMGSWGRRSSDTLKHKLSSSFPSGRWL